MLCGMSIVSTRRVSSLVLFSFLISLSSTGQTIGFDSSFSDDGKETTAIGSGNDFAYSIAVQPDGKILLAGQSSNGSNDDFTIVRYTTTGALDTEFNSTGIVQTPIGTGQDVGYAIAVQPDGKILLGGYTHNGSNRDFALVRYNSNGSLDTTFDSDGKVTTAIGSGNDYAYSIALQPDGKILLGGRSHNGSDYDFAVVRYNANGSLDTDFGSGGKVITDITTNTDNGQALAVQLDGKILLGGYSDVGGGNLDFSLVRYNTNGSLDTTFDTDGIVITAVGPDDDIAQALAIQPDGKIILAGYWDSGSVNTQGSYDKVALLRYNDNGTLDTGFSDDGIYTESAGASTTNVYSLALQSDGKIIYAGGIIGSGSTDYVFLIGSINNDGTPDTTFDSGNYYRIFNFTGGWDGLAQSVAFQGDSKVVIGGYFKTGNIDYDFAIARILNDVVTAKIAPTQYVFTDEINAVIDTLQTSNNITIEDLGTGNVVPIQVTGGEYAINAGDYTTVSGYVTNGDEVSVRHTSAATPETDTNTVLTVGGLHPVNNTSLLLGPTTSDTYTSTTRLLDLSITMTGSSPANPPIDTEISYSVYVSNAGASPSKATGVSVEIQFDNQLLYKSNSGAQWNCSFVNQLLSCNYTSDIDPDFSSSVLTVVAMTPSTATTVTNQASIVFIDQTDSNLSNNTTGNLNTVIGADSSDTTDTNTMSDTTDTSSTNSTSGGGGGGSVNPLFALLFCLVAVMIRYWRNRYVR